jgi:hypothetical protein
MRLTKIAAAFLISGAAVFGFTFARLIRGAGLDPQTKVPGKIVVEIDTPGRYHIWDNHWTRFQGERVKYPPDCPADVSVTVHDSAGNQLGFVADASQGWGIGNNKKTSIGYVDVPAVTTLEVVLDKLGRDRIVSVSNRTVQDELWIRLGGLGLGLVLGVLGGLSLVIGLLARRKKAGVPEPELGIPG